MKIGTLSSMGRIEKTRWKRTALLEEDKNGLVLVTTSVSDNFINFKKKVTNMRVVHKAGNLLRYMTSAAFHEKTFQIYTAKCAFNWPQHIYFLDIL